MPVTRKIYAAIRLTEGKEWLDISSIALFREEAQSKANATDTTIGPHWARANPVVRIVEAMIVETEKPIDPTLGEIAHHRRRREGK